MNFLLVYFILSELWGSRKQQLLLLIACLEFAAKMSNGVNPLNFNGKVAIVTGKVILFHSKLCGDENALEN